MIPDENKGMGDTFFSAVRYISKGRDWSVGVMVCWSVGLGDCTAEATFDVAQYRLSMTDVKYLSLFFQAAWRICCRAMLAKWRFHRRVDDLAT